MGDGRALVLTWPRQRWIRGLREDGIKNWDLS